MPDNNRQVDINQDDVVLTAVPDTPIMRYTSPVIMVGGGAIDHDQLTALAARYPVIAVDGGADVVAQAGLKADAIIGDFDSISSSGRGVGARRIQITDQYSTDFEKAIKVVEAPQIYGFGFLGKRLDHSLGALHVMAAAPAMTHIMLIDPYDVVIMAQGRFAQHLPQEMRISIWPMQQQRFSSSKGLRWPLDSLTLGPGHSLGTSNEVDGHEVVSVAGLSKDVMVEITAEDPSPFAVMMPPEAASYLLP